MKVVPQAFYESDHIKKVMVDGLCCIIHKKTSQTGLDNHRLLAAHALTVVEKGGLSIHTDEGLPVKVNPSEMVLLPKGLYAISDIIPDNESFEATVFFFDDALIEAFLVDQRLGIERPEGHLAPSKFSVNNSFNSFKEQLLNFYGNRYVEPSLVRLKLLETLHLINGYNADGGFLRRLQALPTVPRKNIQRFMSDHFAKPLDIEDFARLSGRSVSTFRRDFHRIFGQSPKQWLIKKRMDRAKQLLEEGQLQVRSVAEHSGYTDIPHFIKSFSKHFDLTPKQYALRHRVESFME